jgi:hypothetical protein
MRMILSELDLSTTSREIARRRLVQSEDEFRLCLKMDDRDEPTEVTDYHPSDGDVDEKEREEKLERIV